MSFSSENPIWFPPPSNTFRPHAPSTPAPVFLAERVYLFDFSAFLLFVISSLKSRLLPQYFCDFAKAKISGVNSTDKFAFSPRDLWLGLESGLFAVNLTQCQVNHQTINQPVISECRRAGAKVNATICNSDHVWGVERVVVLDNIRVIYESTAACVFREIFESLVASPLFADLGNRRWLTDKSWCWIASDRLIWKLFGKTF